VIKVKSTEFNAQLLEICDGLDVIINQNSIDEVAIEDIFFAYNPKTVIKLAQFRGAIALKVLQKFDTFEQYTPLQVKQSLTGNGKADKKQVAFMVKRVLGIKQEIKPLDITDAMAIAITHGQRVKHNRSV
jgi:crossover junction endodeoxyribonuclease RuvC